MRVPDFNEAQRFFKKLDPEATAFTCQTFDDTSAKRGSLAVVHEVDPDVGLPLLASYNQRDAGAFVTVQRTDGRGRQAHNIIEIRALYIDLDSKTVEEMERKRAALMSGSETAPPHLIVQTSATGLHAYWLVRDVPLGHASPLLHSLAAKFGGDHSVCDLARVMRIPGFWHCKGEPFLVRIVYELDIPLYTEADLIERLGLVEWVDPGRAAPAQMMQQSRTMVAEGRRNEHLFGIGRSLAKRGVTQQAIYAALAEENSNHCSPPLSGGQVVYLAERAFTAKDSAGWDPVPRKQSEVTPKNSANTSAGSTTPPEPIVAEDAMVPVNTFMAGWVPPKYLVKGILQEGFLYSLCGHSNAGKTAIAMVIAVHVAMGLALGNHKVVRGKVLYLAGENPDDIRTRFIGLCQHLKLDPVELGEWLIVLPQAFPLSHPTVQMQLRGMLERHGAFALVIQDTRVAYSGAEDENDNMEALADARAARTVMGRACWVALNHPRHGAPADDLRPRGGSSYLGEIDTNLTVWNDEGTTSLGFSKIRGVPFDPVRFKLIQVTLIGFRQSDGDPVITIVAEVITDAQAEQAKEDATTDANRVLRAIARAPAGSERKWAEILGMSRSKVTRVLNGLHRDKLVRSARGRWRLTPAGKAEAELIEQNGVLS